MDSVSQVRRTVHHSAHLVLVNLSPLAPLAAGDCSPIASLATCAVVQTGRREYPAFIELFSIPPRFPYTTYRTSHAKLFPRAGLQLFYKKISFAPLHYFLSP